MKSKHFNYILANLIAGIILIVAAILFFGLAIVDWLSFIFMISIPLILCLLQSFAMKKREKYGLVWGLFIIIKYFASIILPAIFGLIFFVVDGGPTFRTIFAGILCICTVLTAVFLCVFELLYCKKSRTIKE